MARNTFLSLEGSPEVKEGAGEGLLWCPPPGARCHSARPVAQAMGGIERVQNPRGQAPILVLLRLLPLLLLLFPFLLLACSFVGYLERASTAKWSEAAAVRFSFPLLLWLDGWETRWMDGWLDGVLDGWLDGWLDDGCMVLAVGWLDGWLAGWMAGWFCPASICLFISQLFF